MPEQLDPTPREAPASAFREAPPAAGKGGGAPPNGDIRAIVESAPEEAGEAVAANEKAWQAALRAKARGDTEVARRVRAAGLIGDGPMDGGPRDPFWNRDDVLMCSPEQMEIVADFNWADEQRARGAFDAYAGECLAIVNKTVLAVGRDLNSMIAEAAAKAGVDESRVAIYHVEVIDF
jgi:hypothetical protein